MEAGGSGAERAFDFCSESRCSRFGASASAETWRGLTVAPEHRCSSYDRIAGLPDTLSRSSRTSCGQLGAVYGPYTGTCFTSTRESDIEHIVADERGARFRAMCSGSGRPGRRFAQDLRNLTLASPQVNRHQKSGKDAGEWVPERNECWFAGRVLEVKRAYRLTVDRREAAALERIFSQCYGTEMELIACTAPSTGALEAGASAPAGGRRACSLRRQPQRQDHVQRGAPARDRARAPLASRVPVHARRRRRRGCL